MATNIPYDWGPPVRTRPTLTRVGLGARLQVRANPIQFLFSCLGDCFPVPVERGRRRLQSPIADPVRRGGMFGVGPLTRRPPVSVPPGGGSITSPPPAPTPPPQASPPEPPQASPPAPPPAPRRPGFGVRKN